MDESRLLILIAMVVYMSIIICIGLYFAKRAKNYFLGGRSPMHVVSIIPEWYT